MTNEERATAKVAEWLTEVRAALGLSRLELGKLVAQEGGAKSSVWRWDTKGIIFPDELTLVTKLLHASVADVERRVAAAKKLLATTAVPAATAEPATAAAKPKPTKKTAPTKKAPAKKTAPKAIAATAAKKTAPARRATGVDLNVSEHPTGDPFDANDAKPAKRATPKKTATARTAR